VVSVLNFIANFTFSLSPFGSEDSSIPLLLDRFNSAWISLSAFSSQGPWRENLLDGEGIVQAGLQPLSEFFAQIPRASP